MGIERLCKSCQTSFVQYNTLQTRCGKCSYNRYAPKLQQRKPIKKIGKLAKEWIEYRKNWMEFHKGEPWICYLKISPNCVPVLDPDTLTLDHVKPKSGSPKLRLYDRNIRPACYPCNSLKGSRRLENIKEYKGEL